MAPKRVTVTLDIMKNLLFEDKNTVLQKINGNLYDFEKFFAKRNHSEKETDLVVQLIAKAISGENLGGINKVLKMIFERNNRFLTVGIPETLGKVLYGDYDIRIPRLIENYAIIIKHLLKRYPESAFDAFLDVLPNLQNMINHLELSKIKVDSAKGALQYIEGTYLSHNKHLQIEKPSVSFRTLSIFPQFKDIESGMPSLQPNIIDHSYPDVETYLDIHFKLMREDMICTFRVGIENIRLKTHFDKFIKVYDNVSVSYPPEFTVYGISHKIWFECPTAIDWGKKNKLFLPGGIVCLSEDSFKKSIGFATIKKRFPLSGYEKKCELDVVVEEGDFQIHPKIKYSMVDSTAYFESYRHVLSAFKRLNKSNFPLADYIVHLQYDNHIPEDLKDRVFCLHEGCNSTPDVNKPCETCKRFNVLNFEDWPSSDELKFDPYQYSAFQKGITERLALIQGPPGTGKTYLGVKIVKAILENSPKLPIVICCLTNHALDQFLERLVKYTKKVIRLGAQSESSVLEPHKIFNILQAIRRYRAEGEFSFYSKNPKSFEDVQMSESFAIAQMLVPDITKRAPQQMFDEFYYNLKDSADRMNKIIESIEFCTNKYMETRGLNLILSSKFKNMLCGNDNIRNEKFSSNMRTWLDIKQENVYDICKNRWTGASDDEKTLKSMEVQCLQNIWAIPFKVRFHLFYHWRKKRIEELKMSLEKERKTYFQYLSLRSDPVDFDTVELMQNADIIGVTMTGAAKFFDSMKYAEPSIMVVEEAAEALESHLISSLVPSIKRLIMIGDHKQLRPLPASHILATEYNLNISLFERLFMNNAPSATLVAQHRMRPDIADLLVPTIYPALESHASVYEYEDIQGTTHNVFFFKHHNMEDNVSSQVSASNKFEVSFIVNLVFYFLKQGYSHSQITVLGMYAEQVRLLQKECAKELQADVLVTTVDNYQGEENDIIIISFVRSNENGFIGFLKESNRVCVALSRARKGLYCIGNFDMFARVNKLFADVVQKLVFKNQIGDSFPLQCRQHGRIIHVREPQDFEVFIKKGCRDNCRYILPCGHPCTKPCHMDDIEHEKYKCQQPCEKIVIDSTDPSTVPHACKRLCWQPCKSKKKKKLLPCGHKISIDWNEDLRDSSLKCRVEIDKCLSCKHFVKVPCSERYENSLCRALIPITLNCGHTKNVLCSQRDKLNEVYCDDLIPYPAPCGHTVDVPCQESPSYSTLLSYCRKSCDVLLNCGHACVGFCHQCFDMKIHSLCSYNCDLSLSCGHMCQGKCGSPCLPCKLKCSLHCSHGRCDNPCSKPCVHCKKPCERACEHRKCERLCYEICTVPPCEKRCTKYLPCGHECIGLCGDPCPILCRNCNHDLLKSKDPKTDCYIMLEDCDHVVEVMKLTSHINESVSAFVWPSCPECGKMITKSQRYADQLKKCKQSIMTRSCLEDEINEVQFLFRTMFGIDNVVPWRFQNVQMKIQYILDTHAPSEAELIILKVFLINIIRLLRIQEKIEVDLKMESRFEMLIMWMCDHLTSASYQQLNELDEAVSFLESMSVVMK